ncbi:MAG TPA: type II secretion system ATPase GspE [Chlamydiales bacterium]|nr:type II secretion system ATPase GspE [Chlamydiales bacterium]
MKKQEEQKDLLENLYGMEEVQDLLNTAFVKDQIQKLPYAFVNKHLILPIEENDQEMVVVTSDPLLLDPIEELRVFLGKDIVVKYARHDLIKDAVERCYHQKADKTKKLMSDLLKTSKKSEFSSEIKGYDLLERSENNPIIEVLNSILIEAIQQKASDIHFEPQEKDLMIRYRIDGVLHKRHSPPLEYQAQILTRLKVMAKLDIAEKRLPQDGRIKLIVGGRDIDFRVSTMPTSYGERIVLRILDKKNILVGLDSLGMDESLLKQFKKMIQLPEGIILVTGPTGSGKTTTLYSALNEAYSSEKNIMTVEDPVEYKLEGIAQIPVNPKIDLTFAKGLRHILRQDPDIIMIGEIRDRETADIAIQASLTGHLVFSTLHTNDAASAITRLADMGIEPFLLSSSVVGILAQRLVRSICPFCKESYEPSDEELSQLNLSKKQLSENKLFRGKGCDMCHDSGYLGRLGIFELIAVTAALKRQIMQNVDAEDLKNVAISSNMTDLRENGKRLVCEGHTTIQEILRVTKSEEEI